MSDPTRLLSSPESELERALLDAGRSYTASSSMRSKTLLALGLSAVATSTAPAAVAASSSLTKAAFSKVAVAVVVIGAVAAPVWRYLGHPASSAPVTKAAVVAAVPALPPPAVVESAPAPVAALEPAPIAAAEPQPSTPARTAGSTRAAAKPAAAPSLSAELAALDAARSSLSHGDPAAALSALDGYNRDFPRGRLKTEAEVLRIGALAKSGQGEAARKRAEAFLRVHPDSVLASRVRSYAGL